MKSEKILNLIEKGLNTVEMDFQGDEWRTSFQKRKIQTKDKFQ